MAYTPTDITYITLSSADDRSVTEQNFPGTAQAEFLNIFPQTLHLGAPGKRLKVALVSVTYQLAEPPVAPNPPHHPDVPSYPTAFINTNAVVSNIVIGNSFTNNIGRILLEGGPQRTTDAQGQVATEPGIPQQWVADTLYWYDASQTSFAQMDCSITYDRPYGGGMGSPPNNYNVQLDTNSVTYVTFAFKLE